VVRALAGCAWVLERIRAERVWLELGWTLEPEPSEVGVTCEPVVGFDEGRLGWQATALSGERGVSGQPCPSLASTSSVSRLSVDLLEGKHGTIQIMFACKALYVLMSIDYRCKDKNSWQLRLVPFDGSWLPLSQNPNHYPPKTKRSVKRCIWRYRFQAWVWKCQNLN
jgi:hypothetical protein